VWIQLDAQSSKPQEVPSLRQVANTEAEELIRVYSEAFKLAYAGCGYRELRGLYRGYHSDVLASAVYYARKLLKAVLRTHRYPRRMEPAVALKKEDFRIRGSQVSIAFKADRRLVLGIYPSEKQLALMAQAEVRGAKLVKRDGRYFLDLLLEKEVALPEREGCETIIGVDIGINYLAVCSALLKDGRFTNPLFFRGGEWRHLCDRKRKATRVKEFKHMTRRQHEMLHVAAKRVVEYAKRFPKPIIVMERLGRFDNSTRNKRFNFLLGSWARRRLQFMIEYKAKWEGIPVAYVSPAYTSLTCHYCGAKGMREGLTFKCPGCGRTYDADANAAMNLAKRFRKLLDERKAMTEERSLGDLSSSGEGEARLPSQARAQPGSGSHMNRMRVRRTVRLPLGVGSWRNGGSSPSTPRCLAH
jgi:IS605 OrfB family transposase